MDAPSMSKPLRHGNSFFTASAFLTMKVNALHQAVAVKATIARVMAISQPNSRLSLGQRKNRAASIPGGRSEAFDKLTATRLEIFG